MAEPGISLHIEPDLGKLMLRARGTVAERAGETLALALPDAVNRASGEAGLRALRLGPDEFLLLLARPEVEATLQRLRHGLSGLHHAALDVSARFESLHLEGPAAREVLAAACPLDLHPKAFGQDQATRTVFGKAEIVLECRTESSLRLLVNRSLAPYVRGLLHEAGREHGLI